MHLYTRSFTVQAVRTMCHISHPIWHSPYSYCLYVNTPVAKTPDIMFGTDYCFDFLQIIPILTCIITTANCH